MIRELANYIDEGLALRDWLMKEHVLNKSYPIGYRIDTWLSMPSSMKGVGFDVSQEFLDLYMKASDVDSEDPHLHFDVHLGEELDYEYLLKGLVQDRPWIEEADFLAAVEYILENNESRTTLMF